MVMEYAQGGEVFTKLQTNGAFSEHETAHIIKQIVEAIRYCHEKNYIHRYTCKKPVFSNGRLTLWQRSEVGKCIARFQR